jgi:hypothetical protein
METFYWMEKDRRAAGARECGYDLSAHQARLANSGDYDPTPAGQKGFYRPDKIFIQTGEEALDCFGLNADDFSSVAKNLFQKGFPRKKSSRIQAFESLRVLRNYFTSPLEPSAP